MARHALILLAIGLAGCAATDEHFAGNLSRAEIQKSVAQHAPALPAKLPIACTAKMARSFPAKGTPWVITQKRWAIYADDRDAKAKNCETWWDTYRTEMGAK